MISIYPDSKIYVHCPAGRVTGGAEVLHQLVSSLRKGGKDAWIVYYGDSPHTIPSDYQGYEIAMSEDVEDNGHNVEVYHEGIFQNIDKNRVTQKFLWWISVDNFYRCAKPYLSIKDLFRWKPRFAMTEGAKLLLRRRPKEHKLSIKMLMELNATCGYQAEYIQHHLIKLGLHEMVALKDFINTIFRDAPMSDRREDIVVYNPVKGMEFTKRLIAMSPDLKWVPLSNMTRDQLAAQIKKSKIYVDFGEHPGKDRLPRECAMSGCCIITGKKGSAAFFEDVPIPEKYKFTQRKKDVPRIVDMIRQTISEYDTAVNDFEYYRRMISNEKSDFERQVTDLFSGIYDN